METDNITAIVTVLNGNLPTTAETTVPMRPLCHTQELWDALLLTTIKIQTETDLDVQTSPQCYEFKKLAHRCQKNISVQTGELIKSEGGTVSARQQSQNNVLKVSKRGLETRGAVHGLTVILVSY